MITYDHLASKPSAFKSLTGMEVLAFDTLYTEFAPAHAQRLANTPTTKRTQQPRQRAVGAGRPHRHDLRDRLLMALFWLRVYPTYEVLGFFFSLDKTNAEDNTQDVLATLRSLTDFAFDHPAKQRKKLRSPQAVMEAFPDVRLVIDAQEQRIGHPRARRTTTVRSRMMRGKRRRTPSKPNRGRPRRASGRGVGECARRANHDLTLLRQTGLIEQLDADEAAMMDNGYDGSKNDYSHRQIYQPFKARRNHPLTDEEQGYNRVVSSYRMVVEHTLAPMNPFQV